MSGRVVSFFKRTVSRDWSAQELAEFYRVEAALLQSGLRVTLDRGVSDEGDPWFVFCRAEDDEVIVHFARIEGRYLISAPSFGGNVTGFDFRALVRDMVARNPVLRPAKRDENVTLHPSALLVVLVASALLKMSHAAEAAAVERPAGTPAAHPDAAPPRIFIAGVEHIADLVSQETQQYAALLSAIALSSGPSENQSIPVFVVTPPAHGETVALHEGAPHHLLPMDWSALSTAYGGDSVGGGSVTPAPQAPAPSSVPDGLAHAHDLAAAQTQPAQAGGLAVLFPDVTVASPAVVPAAPPQMAPAADTSTAPVANTASLIQANHDFASSLLQAVGGNEPIVYSQTVPDAFLAPLHGSVHTSAATLIADPNGPATTAATPVSPSAPASVAPVFVAGGAGFDATPSAGIDTSFGAAPSSSLIPVQTSGPGASEFAAVLSIMQNFAQVVGSHLAILVSGNQVIEYDYFAVDYTPAAVSAVTYDFPDGSHVSLVGLRSELPHTAV